MFVTVGVGLLVGCVVTSISTLFSSSSLNLTQTLATTFKSLNLGVQLGDALALPTINKEIAYEWGTRLLCGLPAGLSSHKVIDQKRAIAEALRSDIDLYWQNGLIIDIFRELMVKKLPFDVKARHDHKIALGVNRRGEVVYYDFAGSFPHFLIGGISGGGKSVLLHSILTQLALGPQPDLYLNDLKGGVELGLYRDLAITKGFGTTIRDVARLATEAETEMERRYAIMARNGSQSWDGKKLIFVWDEMADMKIGKGDPEAAVKASIKMTLTRISAKGRAAGVILLLCTQRPDASVVDGLIKTNIATSLCFRTRDDTQSRIILDNNDAADLPDVPGRCIFQQAHDVTLQTYFITYEQAKKLIAQCKRKAVESNEPSTDKGYAMDSNIGELG